MPPSTALARNTAVQVGGKVFSILLGIVTLGILTRGLGREGFGQYATAVAFVQFFSIVADLGLYLVTLRALSQPGADRERLFGNILALRMATALPFVVLAPLAILVFPVRPAVRVGVFLAAVSILFVSENQVLLALYQRSLAMTRAVAAEVAGKLALLVLAVIAIGSRRPLYAVLVAVAASGLVQMAVSLVLARRFARIRPRFDLEVWKRLLRESVPLALSIVLNLIYFRSDTIILALFHPPATVGLYGASYKVLEVLIAIPAMFAGLLVPPLAYHHGRGDAARFLDVFQKGFDVLVTLALPIVAGVMLLAGPIIRLVAGGEFAASAAFLRILVLAAGTIFLGTLFGNTVVAIGRQERMLRVYLAVAILGLAGYLIVIPPFGAWGAAAMTVATEVAITLGAFSIVRRATGARLSGRQARRALGAVGVMSAGVVLASPAGLLFAIPAGAGLYLVALRYFGGLRPDLFPEALGPAEAGAGVARAETAAGPSPDLAP